MTYNRYHNGKIYQITNNIDDMVYIGSTCLPLRKRIYNHKKEYHSGKGPNRRLFQHTEQYGWDEFDIILVEEEYILQYTSGQSDTEAGETVGPAQTHGEQPPVAVATTRAAG